MPRGTDGAVSDRLSALQGRGEPGRHLAKLFPDCAQAELFVSAQPWPELEGCLGILFTSRSGSTYLSREIESRYRIGQIGETLNPPQLRSRALKAGLVSPALALRHSVRTLGEGGWFGFKAGPAALAGAEHCGFVDNYLPRMKFILLFRRDIVAQAVSSAKAQLTGRFHSTQEADRQASADDYAYDTIFRKTKTILKGMRVLQKYARLSGRPVRSIFYEDFREGDFTTVAAACDAFEIPLRPQPKTDDRRAVARIGDEVNKAWCCRFRAECAGEAAEVLEQYRALLQG
jgi:LPS sulfotransferase NodH